MNNQPRVLYQFLSHIDAGNEDQLALWSKKFSISPQELKNIIRIAGPVVKDIHDYLQTLKPTRAGYRAKDQILTEYKQLLEQRVKEYLDDFKTYDAHGNAESFATRYWPILMNEVAEETDKILEQLNATTPEKLQLVSELEQIAAVILLNVKVPEQL